MCVYKINSLDWTWNALRIGWWWKSTFDSSTCAWQTRFHFWSALTSLVMITKREEEEEEEVVYTFCCITIFTEFEPPHRLMIQPLSLSSFNQVLPYFFLLLLPDLVRDWSLSLPCFSHTHTTNKNKLSKSLGTSMSIDTWEKYISNQTYSRKVFSSSSSCDVA